MNDAPDRPTGADPVQWLHTISELMKTATPDDYFPGLAMALAEALQADHVIIGQLQRKTDTLSTLAMIRRGSDGIGTLENRHVPLPGTAHAEVLRNGRCVIPGDAATRFPHDLSLRESEASAYLGLLVQSPRMDVNEGLVSVMFRRPLSARNSEHIASVLQVLSLTIASELNRMQAEKWLQQTRYYADEGMRHSPIAMLITNRSGRIRQSNTAFSNLSGYFARDIQNLELEYFFPEQEKPLIEQCLDQLLGQQTTHLNVETRILDWQYQDIEVSLDCYSLTGESGQVRNIVIQLEDITEQKRAARQVGKLLQSIELSPVATVITDKNAVIEYVNPRFSELTGFSQLESIGRKTNINASGETPPETYRAMWQQLLKGRQWQGELLNRRKDGSLYWARTIIFPIVDSRELTTNFVSLQEDISESRRLSLQLEYEATHDQLTGLINRREFQRRLEQAIDEARIDEVQHALCFLDLDRFKVINDTSGHVAGDALLSRISKTLLQHIRANDTVARVGGDEFALILRNCDISKARDICDKIRQAVNEMVFPWEDQVYSVGLSAGLTIIDGRIIDPVELIKQVDAACYHAKDSGKNRVVVYQQDDQRLQQQRHQSQWVPRLENALKNRQFQLFVQPIFALQNPEERPHYEVLVRLLEADGTLVMPGQFLPTAERFGLAPQVDRLVFDELYDFLTANPSLTETSSAFSINLSGASISENELLSHIIATIRNGPVPPGLLHFEVTETAAVSSINEARHFMHQLRGIGSRVILDDFGRGLSSFAYLKNLPVDMLKIDGLFVREILEDYTDHTMVRMINELAHSLGLETIAEYIETEQVKSCIQQLGIDYGQGFHMARPGPIAALLSG